MKSEKNVIIADNSTTFIGGLCLLFSKQPRFEVVDICENGQELVNSKYLANADLLLVDIEMPEMNGLEAAKKISKKFPALPMIAMTLYNDKVYLRDIVSAGFKGFLNKLEICDSLFKTIDEVLDKKYFFSDKLIEKNKNYG